MSIITLTPELITQIAALYHRMEEEYDIVARALDFSCQGCPDNCCDSFFLHHTYTEWTYLRQGLFALSDDQQTVIKKRAQENLAACSSLMEAGKRPEVMCPLNEEGLCILYKHRLMICRLHGVPSWFSLPDGRKKEFSGCFRCQEQVAGQDNPAAVDRTPLFQALADLEKKLLRSVGQPMPRVKMTIAQMIIEGPPGEDLQTVRTVQLV